jgi:hypothetical protein
VKPLGHEAAFSAIEMILVTAATGIVVVGMIGIIEVPRRMSEAASAENPSISSAKASLAQLDRDLRFAAGVASDSPGRIDAFDRSGRKVSWEWTGATRGRLIRTDGDGPVEVLGDVGHAAFSLGTALEAARTGGDGTIVSSGVRAASFAQFALKPGFAFEPGVGATQVEDRALLQDISALRRAAIVLDEAVLAGLGGNEAITARVVLRLERRGAGGLVVEVLEIDPVSGAADRAAPVATGRLTHRELPLYLSDVAVPLAAARKLRAERAYLVEIRADSLTSVAALETRYLSIPAAGDAIGSSLLVSSDAGSTYRPVAAVAGAAAASQTRFQLDVLLTHAAVPRLGADATPGFATYERVVRVDLDLSIATPLGDQSIEVSFPLLNAGVATSR